MSTIDRQRVAAVRLLEAMGYVFRGHEWVGPAIPATFEGRDARAARPAR